MTDTKPIGEEVRAHELGFDWGPASFERYAVMPDGTRVVGVRVNGKDVLSIYISPQGRSVRVFRKGKGELLPREETS